VLPSLGKNFTQRRQVLIAELRVYAATLTDGGSYYFSHILILLKTLLLREENRRLKRNWPIDLI
jgi:hypothetical protein